MTKDRQGSGRGRRLAAALALLVGATTAGCAPEVDLTIPGPQTVRSYYGDISGLQVEISGNVARISVVQGTEQLRQGGGLWAKAGPYIYLFSEQTRQLLAEHPGLGGVRVSTRTPGGTWIAEALLERSALNAVTWRRALTVAGEARTRGGESPGYMSALVRYGEDRTEFRYNPAYAR